MLLSSKALVRDKAHKQSDSRTKLIWNVEMTFGLGQHLDLEHVNRDRARGVSHSESRADCCIEMTWYGHTLHSRGLWT